MDKFPKFQDLPIKPGAPKYSAWGVFDENRQRDALGTLNFITPEVVVAAKQEIATGEAVILSLPLHLPYNTDKIKRFKFCHHVTSGAFGMACCDDEVHLNTQSSSQWDGLLHYAHQSRREFYNGVKYADAAETRTDLSLGINVICERGGIVGRGILLDFVRYADRHNISYNPLKKYAISLKQVREMITEEHLIPRQGDVLLIRTGVSKWILDSTPESTGYPDALEHIGIDGSEEMLEWLWDHRIAAVGGDAMAFEVVPGVDGSFMSFHEVALAGWGMPIGELLDLERLAQLAEKHQRWSFFITVCPLNVIGGIATPANTLAVF